MKKLCSLFLALVMLLGLFPSYALAGETASPWDLFEAETANYTEDFQVINSSGGGAVAQEDGYINITKGDDKSNTATGKAYTWVAPKSAPVLPKDGPFTVEASIRVSGPVEGARTNEFSVRVDGTGRYFPVFLQYGTGDDGTGGVTNLGDFSDVVPVDTTQWHTYGLVIDPRDNNYKVYVDGVQVLERVSTWELKGADLVRVGADVRGRSDMDVQFLRVGTGNLEPHPVAVDLSDFSQKADEAKTVTVTVAGENLEDTAAVAVRLVNSDGTAVESVAADGAFTDNTASVSLAIPSGLAAGTYYVEAEAAGGAVRSEVYTVESVLARPAFPTFAPTGYAIDMADYQYNPTEEFNFPTIVDTKAHPVNNAFGDDAYRYYLFYAPHDAPAGNCVAASNFLEGPWVEYENNPVVTKDWAPNYNVSHVSSPQVLWIEEQGCYVMYFHGENSTTRYATSTDLLNWTYGGVCIEAKDFNTSDMTFHQASYAKVFEHAVPGLANKYIMLMMVTHNISSGNYHSNIGWAHSTDGVSWTAVKTPLVDPDIDAATYGTNLSGPWFMELEGRYFVICHASSGEMYAFEVGEKLDRCTEWGEFYNSQGVRNVDDANADCYPDYGRSGAPSFIQDDEGRWHMFYEAGKRLNTNTVHAIEVKDGEEKDLARVGLELGNTNLRAGDDVQPTLRLFDKNNRQVAADTEGLVFTYHVSDPAVLRYESGTLTALAAGDSTAWVTAELEGKTAVSPKISVTVTAAGEAWNLLNADTANYKASFGETKKVGLLEQKDGYVNIRKGNDQSNTAATNAFTWLTSQQGLSLPTAAPYTVEASIRLAAPVDGDRTNELSVRTGGKLHHLFLRYGEEGGVSALTDFSIMHKLDTTVWHNYGMVVNPDHSYTIYVDGEAVASHTSTWTMSGDPLVRIGADSRGRCDMDVQSLRVGTGDLSALLGPYEGGDPDQSGRIKSVTLSSDTHEEGNEVKVDVIVATAQIADGQAVALSLVDSAYQPVAGVEATCQVAGDQAKAVLTIPAAVGYGEYYVQAAWNGKVMRSAKYTVTSSRAAPVFPTFASTGYTIEMADYKYNPTEEFNFPDIVDTRDHPVTNRLGNYRYYLFYAPHDAPAGNCVAASNSLDGPWVEYESNPVVANAWPKEDGSGENYYKVSHVSSPHVMWLEEKNCYIMYYHGENTTTRYALSDDLVNWTYGGVCVTANQFSATGSGFSEASYAKVYEHEVEGLGNKYIMLLMVTGSGNSMHRNIYWAHSKDGVNWTPVKESLLNPDMNSVYKSNFSGPWFMEWDGRYYVICHASSGEMYAFEVGENLDQCIEWGEVYNSQGDRGPDDANPNCYPDYGRSGAPYFIQDDAGRWHMFYEAGKRLNTNIVHAVEVKPGEEQKLARAGLELENTTLAVGGTATPVLDIFNQSNEKVASAAAGLALTCHVGDERVIRYENGVVTALAEGTSTAWVEIARGDEKAVSQKVEITVSAPAKEIIITNADTPNRTALNLELPAIFKAQGVLANPIDNYYLYFSYTDESGGAKSIALATAPAPEGPWTVYRDGTPVMTRESLGLSGTVNAPWPIWDAANSRMLMYYSQGAAAIGVAESADGITFTNAKTVFEGKNAPVGTQAYQQSVYEYAIPGKDNKYLMLITGNGYKETGVTTNGKQIFYAWSNDGLTWTADNKVLVYPDAPGDKGNIASPRLLVKDGEPYVVYHNSNGNIGYSKLSADFSAFTRAGRYYNSIDNGEPDRGRAADAAFLEADGSLYLYYTARSNKAGKAADASLLVCRKMGSNDGILFQDDFGDGNADGWTTDGGTWAVADGAYVQSETAGGYHAFAGDLSWTDYELEVKVTPVSIAATKLGVMLNGRAADAKNRYIGSYNSGKLSINRRIDGADKELAQKEYAMSVGTRYTMKMVFRGDRIELYVNGVKELEATDSTYSAGRIGLSTYQANVAFDDVIVRAVSGEPAPAGPIAVTDFGDHQVLQRDVEKENVSVAVRGTAGVAAAKVEARVVGFESGEVKVDWTTVAERVAEGAAWLGSITVPQGGWYKLEVRALDENGQELGTAQGTHKWGVGVNILCIGQSNMVGQAPETPRTQADDMVANYTRSGNWTHLADPYDGAGGSMVPAMGNALVKELGIPVGFIPAADSGSGLHAPNVGHAATRYWMYYTTPGDTSTLYGKAVTRAKAAGGVELAVWNQGETDGRLMIAEEIYESDMKTLLSRLRTDLSNEKLPIFLCQIGTHNPNIANDAAYSAIRSAQHDLDDGENFFLAATEMEFARKDTAHYRKAGMDEIGRRVANSVLYYYGESGYYRGPYLSGAAYADDTRTVIDVKITHRGGADITPAVGSIPGFTVLDGLKDVSVISAVRKDATTVRLTLSAPISGSGSVRYLYGLNPYPDTEVAEGSTVSDLKNDAIVIKDNTALALPLENTTTAILVDGDEPPVVERWNLMDHAMGPDWTVDGWRTSTKQGNGAYMQENDYLNINKPNSAPIGSAGQYHWAVSPATLALPRNGFTLQVRARAAGEVEAQANEIGVRMGLNANDTSGQLAAIFLGYGEEGFVSSSVTGTGRFTKALDTTVWHDYTLVARQEGGAYVFDLYVDDTLAFENVPFVTYKGGDLIRMGADVSGRCNLDVQAVRLSSGEVLPEGVSPARVTDVSLSAQSQKETESKTITVTVTGKDFADGEKVSLALMDRSDHVVSGVSAQASFTGNTAASSLTIPAGLSATTYYVRAEANGRVRYSGVYTVEADRTAPIFPQFTSDGFTIELGDYKYNPTNEFNFPSILDTKDHPVSNAMGDYRYYLFYAPHDAPAGNCVAASNSLDGPWVEYGNNPVVAKTWPKEDGSGENWYSVSHVSSPYVMWNDVYDCWFMYFHGENNITRYATSDDLLNWTYGGICVTANDFSPTGSGLSEASYAKAFEHEVPGLGNKYVMLLMVTGTATGGHRNIYWAHSVDGKTWTAVQTSLLDPMMDAGYKGNFSGPWLMERDGRYFVICHASSGNMYAFEVGERLNECIPWGVFYDSIDSSDPNDPDHDDAYPDYGRAGAPSFMKDDDGVWHMFYEGGKRLHANIVHATAPADPVDPDVPDVPEEEITNSGGGVIIEKETLPDGTQVTTRTNKAIGTVSVTTMAPDGTKTVSVTKKNGLTTATVTIPAKVGQTTVLLPNVTGNTVILVNADGSERVLTLAVVEDGQAKLRLDGSAKLRFEERESGFSDISDAGIAEAAAALAASGVFQGTGAGTFSPSLGVDRATIVTLLHRIDGSPLAESGHSFTDVLPEAWYSQGVAWASEKGVTLGVGNGHFAPSAVLTWEQVAVMFYRYAKTEAAENSGKTETELALAWCSAGGVGESLTPGEPLNRGALAQVLYQYIKALVG